MRRSSSCHRGRKHLQDIFESTIGIMAFGTPHGGADPRGFLQRIAEKAIKAAGFSVNEQIVNNYTFAASSGHKVVGDTSSYLNLPAIGRLPKRAAPWSQDLLTKKLFQKLFRSGNIVESERPFDQREKVGGKEEFRLSDFCAITALDDGLVHLLNGPRQRRLFRPVR
ncbi:hypothetical protein K469DRAFT_683245 [Zopfia rhizophila CBS 207.26]|uniref:Uncharacterized protein n=1 Tax=Zopfia rhizophila CBS 207.26 TaxID=1314779 RepID=A0A6A6EIZ6_9PEZI|nr:hypothetical protein K469DRAFT_683245 [Zopfia rhizophila CBS 207.26]